MGRLRTSQSATRLSVWVLLACALLSFSLGCSRKVKKDTSVKLSIATNSGGKHNKLESLSSDYRITFILINVSGPGISPTLIFDWDGHCGGVDCPPAPSAVEFNVPTGAGRLIQVLVVYADSDGGEEIYYGDATADLTQSSATVSVTTSSIMTIAGTEVMVAGRYLDGSAVGGPSGMLETQFVPPNNRPPMFISRTPVFAGWIQVQAIDGVPFNYILNGQPFLMNLFPGSAAIAPSSALVSVRVPAADNTYTDSNSNSITETRSEYRVRVGYFGPAVGTQKACYDNRADQTLSGLYEVATSTALKWDGAAPASNEAGPEAGGMGFDPTGSGNVCHNLASAYDDHMVFDTSQIRNGHDSVAGFRGPFRSVGGSSGSPYFTWTKDGSDNLTVNWKYLPGVTRGGFAVSGISIFKRAAGRASGIWGDNGVRCTRLPGKGYVKVGSDFPATLDQVDGSATVPGVETNSHVVLCPYVIVNGIHQIVDAGVDSEIYSGGSGSSYANDFQILAPDYNGIRNYAHDNCIPVDIEGLVSGQPTNFPAGATLTLTSSDPGTIVFYNNANDCDSYTNPISAPVNLNYEVRKTIWMSSETTGVTVPPPGRSLTVQLAGSGGLNVSKSLTFGVDDTPGTPTETLFVRLPGTLYAHSCYSYQIESWHDIGGTPLMIIPQSSYYLTVSATDHEYYDQMYSSCIGSTTGSANLSSFVYRGFFKYKGVSATIGINPTGGPAVVGATAGVTVQQPGTPANVWVNMPNQFQEGQCQIIDIQLVDSNSRSSPAAGTMNFTMTPVDPGDTFFNDDYCGSALGGPVSLSAGQSNKRISYKSFVTGAGTISASDGAMTGTHNVTVLPPTAATLVIVLPGQTLSGLSAAGVPFSQPVGGNLNTNLYAVNYDGTVDTTYSGYLTQINSAYLTGLPSPASVIFTNGVASFNATVSSANNFASLNAYMYKPSGNIYGGSSTFEAFSPATEFKVLMNYSTSLIPGACQPFLVLPADVYGYAKPLNDVTTVNLSATVGGIYTDKDCLSAAAASFNTAAGVKHYLFFYKNPSPSSAGTIDTTSAGYNASFINILTAAGGTVGAAMQWQLLGWGSVGGVQTLSNRCQPYTGYLADSTGMFVAPGADVTNMRVMMQAISGTTGAFYDSIDCSTSLLDVTDITLPSATGIRNVWSSAPANPTNGQRMTIKDMTTTYTTNFFDLYRAD